MSRAGWALRAAAAVLLQILLFSRPLWQGAFLLPVPVLAVWTGLSAGAGPGAGIGLLMGGLLYLLGGSPWEIGVLSLLGGLSGAAFPQTERFWEKCLLALPLLAGWSLLRLLALWCGGGDVLAALPLVGREWLLCIAVLPLVGSLCRSRKRRCERG